jgi:hypothetical protein
MIKQIFFTIFFIAIAFCCFAQDIIVTTDAQKIEAKILEVSESVVKYKEMDNIEGPTFVLSTENISSIIYENGKVTLYQGTLTEERKLDEPKTATSYVTRLGEKYTYKGNVMTGDEYANFLRINCPNAYHIYHSGYTISYVGICFLAFAAGLEFGTLIGGAILGGYNYTSMTLVYCGLGCMVVSVPLLIVGFNKMHKSVDVFNQECLNINRTQSYWSINANRQGIGIALNF